MPDEVPGGTGSGVGDDPPLPAITGPIWRAAPTPLATAGWKTARARRWLIVVAIVVAVLLAGASLALTQSGPARSSRAHAAGPTTSAGAARQN
jgi:hypothetical protein